MVVELARAALAASGVTAQSHLEQRLAMIDQLCRAIGPVKGEDDIKTAESIFRWLWRSKPRRYQQGGPFKLTEVLDAQLGEQEVVGNCLGLTVLFNIIAQQCALQVTAIHVENAFGIGPHVFSMLHAGAVSIDIENALPQGFNYEGHKGNSHRDQWDNEELVADLYHSAGNECFESGRLEDALGEYEAALRLNPGYSRARLNTGIALAELGRLDKARDCLR